MTLRGRPESCRALGEQVSPGVGKNLASGSCTTTTAQKAEFAFAGAERRSGDVRVSHEAKTSQEPPLSKALPESPHVYVYLMGGRSVNTENIFQFENVRAPIYGVRYMSLSVIKTLN